MLIEVWLSTQSNLHFHVPIVRHDTAIKRPEHDSGVLNFDQFVVIKSSDTWCVILSINVNREEIQTNRKLAPFSGSSIERLCDVAASDPTGYAQLDDRGPMVRAARALLGSVTRVLLLADIVVVKQLLLAKDRVRQASMAFVPPLTLMLGLLTSTDIKDIR